MKPASGLDMCEASQGGQWGAMPTDALDRPRRGLTPLAVVTVAATVFALLLVLVRVQWAPLESVDHGAAARINGLIAGHATIVTMVKAVTWLGSDGVLTRRATGQPVTNPVTEGLEPEASADLRPGRPERTSGLGGAAVHRGRTAAGVLVAWVLILGAIVGVGELITKGGNGNVLGDRTIPRWFAAHRTPSLNHWSQVISTLGATQAILIVALATCVVFLAVTRHWRPVVFIATVMFGELGAFLAAAAVVKRPRPDVTHLDSHLPTSAFPSGHEAATCCLYVAVAILVIGRARGWWRWLFLAPAIVMPVLVALSRMYRGEHHPTDILGSLLFAALWLTATTLLIKPNADEAGRRATFTTSASPVTSAARPEHPSADNRTDVSS